MHVDKSRSFRENQLLPITYFGMNARLNFRYEYLLKLGEEFKSAIQGRMRWGDTLFLTLGRDENRCLVVWTPKETSERDHLPGFYTDDGKFFMKVKAKPGAWVTYADLGQIRRKIEVEQHRNQADKTSNQNARSLDNTRSESAETLDSKAAEQEVFLGVRELERNTKNIVDFAGGLVPEFTVTHRGRPIKLADLLRRPEELQVELRLLRGFKTGAYILVTESEITTEDSLSPAEIIIPEKTISAGVHLNADELISRLSDENERYAIALYSSYLRQYPDFQDFQHYFHLREQLEEAQVKAKILIGAAVHDPINRDGITIRAFSVNSDNKKIERLIADSEKPLSDCFEEVNEKIASISANHQGRVRERVGMWNVSRNIISSILDEDVTEEQATTQGNPAVQRIISEETSSAIIDFMDFSSQLFEGHFQTQTAEKLIQELENYHEQIKIAAEERGYISSNDLNNFIGKATALVHDGVMEEQFVQSGDITTVDIKIFEDGREISQIDFPVTASWEIEEMPETLSLSTTQRRRHAELLSQTLDIENSARRFGYGLREVLNPLYDILLSVNSDGEFEIDSEIFAKTIEQIKFYRSDIRECILHAPSEAKDYYAKLCIIISKEELKERLCDRIGYFEGMTLSNPEEVNELLTSIQNGEFIQLDDREQSQLLKNLGAEVEARTGGKLTRFKSRRTPKSPSDSFGDEKLLQIHCDEVLSAIKVALQNCLKTLDANAKDLTDTMNLDDKQLINKLKRRYGKGRGKKSKNSKVTLEDVYAERRRINISLERIIDGKMTLRDCLERLEQHKNVIPQLLNRLRTQPDTPILPWTEEKVEPELPIIEPEVQKEVGEVIPIPQEEELEPIEETIPETIPEILEEPPAETVELERIEAETVTEPISEEEIEVSLPEAAGDYDIVAPETTAEELPVETIEVREEPVPIITPEQEVTRPEEILPEETPAVEELQPEAIELERAEEETVIEPTTAEELPVETIEVREEPGPIVTPEQEVTRPEEILPEEIPSVEELQEEFSLLSRNEIHEAVDAGLSSEELREYLELRMTTAKEAEADSVSEAEPAQPTKTWQERIDIEQYPNIRAFLQDKQLKLTTTGRQLANLKRISEDISREGQILIAEILELRDNNYSQEVVASLIAYLTDELSRWESENITEQQLPRFAQQRVLSFYVCYEREMAELLEIATRYENLIDNGSPLQSEYKNLEERYIELIETL